MLHDTSDKPGASNDHEEEATEERIVRYCFGRPLMPMEMDKPLSLGEEGLAATAAVPPFGRLDHFKLDEKRHDKLWRFDIRRLKGAAEAPNVDLLQPNIKTDKTLGSLAVNKRHSYELGRLADQILYGLWVFSYEDEAVLQKYDYPPSNPERMLDVFWNFQRILGEVPDLPFTERSRRRRTSIYPERSWDEVFNNPRLEVLQRDQYCYVVDQITSILAKVAWSSSGSSYWKVVVLACLTKISTKLKVLATCLPKAVENCMEAHRMTEDTWRDTSPHTDRVKQPIIANYCEEYIAVSTWLVECIEHVLRNLGAEPPLDENRGHLDLSTLVYEAGTRGIRTQIYQDRWAGLSGSTDRLGITWALTALGVGLELLKTGPPPAKVSTAVKDTSNTASKATRSDRSPLQSSSRNESEEETVIQFTAEVGNIYRVRNIENIIDFVVMLTPLSLASPILGRGFADNIGAISSRVEIYWGTPQKIVSHKAFFSMQRFERRSNSCGSPSTHQRKGYAETTSLSRSWLVEHRHNPSWRKQQLSSSSLSRQLKPTLPRPPCLQAREDRERVTRFTDAWTIHETSIVIRYSTYVNTVFGFTVVLVVGGFLCGLLVGSRVEGVDPFNFTAFSWLLGGFILLIAKIVKVSDWTWRDFLQRQVTCRSVCEVANVSKGRLSQQEVLAYLLSSESRQILKTAGPFQKIFNKDAVDNGFSIDVNPDIQTLLASGIIIVKVLTVGGEALLWLRLIPGGPVQHIPVSGKVEDTEVFACIDLPKSGEGSESLAFNLQKLSWTKVLGVYNAVEKHVR